MIYKYGFTPEELVRSYDELVKRHVLGAACVEKSRALLIEKGLFPGSYQPSMTPAKEKVTENGKVFELEGHFEPWVPARIDYLNDYR
jgi:hypothetical protein